MIYDDAGVADRVNYAKNKITERRRKRDTADFITKAVDADKKGDFEKFNVNESTTNAIIFIANILSKLNKIMFNKEILKILRIN